MTRFLVFVLLWMAASLAGAADLLHPAQAFKPTARALDGRTVEVRFAIADGYYLYRDKFRFAVETEGVKLGMPSLPKGKEKIDETFGNVEVFYREVLIRLPVERNSWVGRATMALTRSASTIRARICPSPPLLVLIEPFAMTTPACPVGDSLLRMC